MASASGVPPAYESLRCGHILSSRLYFDVPCPKVPVVYSPDYNITFHGLEKHHPFDSSKWGRVCSFPVEARLLHKDRIVEPLEASDDDLLVVRSETYLNSLKSSEKVARIVEVGGSVLSAKLALERGWAINIGGGFHHCSAEEGGGFCAYADISLCIHFALVRLNISRVMIIDLDAHQGNGHEKDFGSDAEAEGFTFWTCTTLEYILLNCGCELLIWLWSLSCSFTLTLLALDLRRKLIHWSVTSLYEVRGQLCIDSEWDVQSTCRKIHDSLPPKFYTLDFVENSRCHLKHGGTDGKLDA